MAVADFCWKVYWNTRADDEDPIVASGRSGITQGDFVLILENVREKLEPGRRDVLLDMGCGNGLFLKHLSPLVQAAMGVDFSPAMIRKARSELKGCSNVELRQGELTRLPFRRMRFSKILCNGALQYLNTFEEVGCCLAEIKRCGEKGGTALLGGLPCESTREKYLDGIRQLPLPEKRRREILDRNTRALWFSPEAVVALTRAMGMSAEVLWPDESLSHARSTGWFDIRICL